jgi:two-component system, cell cycle sensor histidine kinase and response regulator CckA
MIPVVRDKNMKDERKTTSGSEELRRRAEERLSSRPVELKQLSPEEAQTLLQELQIHQVELEMQNEQLRQTQAELETALTKYSDFYDFAPVAYLTLDERGLILEANLTAATMLGVKRTGLLQRPVTNYIVKEDRNIYFRQHQQLLETQGPQHYELRMLQKDGTPFWTGISTIATLDNNNARLCKATISDITGRKRAEEAFRVLVNRAPLGIFLIQDGNFVLVNPGFEAISGYREEELLGRKSHCLAAPESDKVVRREAIKRLKGETSVPFEFQFIAKNGETRWGMETLASTIYLGNRVTLGYFLDITEHKTLEAQFLQAQKMEAVGRLAGGVAHDFNNLLSVIFGYGDLINQKIHEQDPLARYLGEIMKASDRAAALTRQLLAFSRKTILMPQILNLNDQLTEIEKMLARLLGEDIEIWVILDPALGAVNADPGHIEQIVMNLAVNARDALPKGGKLTLETANVYLDEDYAQRHTYVTPGHFVMLAVTDNGQGMDAATKARIFEPFFTTKELGRGTGLGMSTVYGLVKQNGGYIEVESEVGHGTTIKVYLPRVQETVATVSAAKPIDRDLHGSETILVVEDEDMLRESICRGLKIYGYTVLAARDGGEAIFLCEGDPGPIDLLLTDVVMPQMNGRDLADRLSPLQPEIKVLYMSGYTENAIVHHGVLETGISFIQKPFRIKKLMEKIRGILDNSPRQP